MQLSRHTGTGWSGGGGGSSGTRGRTDSDGAEQRPPGRPLLCLPERAAVCLRRRGQVRGSVAARGNAAAVVAAATAAARAGGRIRTGRSSDRLGGRCSVCLSAPSVRSSSAVRCTGKRGGAGTRGGGGEQASGPRAARRTGDRQAGDGPESDRAQRSERADRRSAAADLEGVRSATVGVGGRPSCGEEGGRQVRVVRVALHRPVERHSSRDRA